MLKKQDMSNAAYSEEYHRRNEEFYGRFFANATITEEEPAVIAPDITLLKKYCEVSQEEPPTYWAGSDNDIFIDGKKVYSFRSVDEDGTFCKLITHSNGKRYLIFRRDLYGYSLLEIETLRDFHYFPACHLKPNAETFIWTDVLYNSNSNLMVVDGCYWACPWDLALVDFSDPLQPAENQVCISFKKDVGTINSYRWEGTDLIIRSSHSKWMEGKEPQKGQSYDGHYITEFTTKTYRKHKLSEALCRKWLAEGNYVGRK